MAMDRQIFGQIIDIVTVYISSGHVPRDLIQQAFYGTPLVNMINPSGTPNSFAVQLVTRAEQYGQIEPGVPALVKVLEVIRGDVGFDKQYEIDVIIADLTGKPRPVKPTPPPEESTPAPATSASVPDEPTAADDGKRNLVFISYSHDDKKWFDKINIALKPKLRKGVNIWTDQQIEPGMKWRAEIENALKSAKVALFLVSMNFLASDFIMDQELPVILEAADKEGVTVLWVPIGYSDVKGTPLYEYQGILSPGSPLNSLQGPEQEKALVDIANYVQKAYEAK